MAQRVRSLGKYRGPPAAPPLLTRRGQGPPAGAKFKQRLVGVSTDPSVYAQFLVAQTIIDGNTVRVEYVEPPKPASKPRSNGASGGGSGGNKEWSPSWNWEFGKQAGPLVAVFNLLANAELLTPVGRQFKPDSEYRGDGSVIPPQRSPHACHFDNVYDMEGAKLDYQSRTFHSKRSRGWPQNKSASHLDDDLPKLILVKPQQNDRLDISAFTSIREAANEGTVVHDSTEEMTEVDKFLSSFPVDVAIKLQIRRSCAISQSMVVSLKPDKETVRVIITKPKNSHTVLEMNEVEFLHQLDNFMIHVRSEQVDLEKWRISSEATDCFFCWNLKDISNVIHQKTYQPPGGEFSSWPETDLQKLWGWYRTSSAEFHKKNPMRMDWTNPPVSDTEDYLWYKEYEFGIRQFHNKVMQGHATGFVKPPEIKSDDEEYYRYWDRLFHYGSDPVSLALTNKVYGNQELASILRKLEEVDYRGEDYRYQVWLMKNSGASADWRNMYGEHFPALISDPPDVSFSLFNELRQTMFIKSTTLTRDSLIRDAVLGVKRWLDKPAFTGNTATKFDKIKRRIRSTVVRKKAVDETAKSLAEEIASVGSLRADEGPLVPLEFEARVGEMLDKARVNDLSPKVEAEIIAILSEQISQRKAEEKSEDDRFIQVIKPDYLFSSSFREELSLLSKVMDTKG